KVVLINEIFTRKENQKEKLTVRVLGLLKEINIGSQLGILEFEGFSIVFSLSSFISNLPSKLNCTIKLLVNYIKQIQHKKNIFKKRKLVSDENINEEFMLNARIYRLVEDIDINLFKESLSVKRKFESQINKNKIM
ncbi:hypothetical protein DICPUDRAFT_37241, partial [Dictyostelium purpureum]